MLVFGSVGALGMLEAGAKQLNVLTKFLPLNKIVSAEIGVVAPPPEIQVYQAKVLQAAKDNPDWYQTYSKGLSFGKALPFHPQMGLSKQEHEEYLTLWKKRAFKVLAPVEIKLVEIEKNGYSILGAGPAVKLTVLKYYPDKNTIESPKGVLSRLPDIQADQEHLLGAWSAFEWGLKTKDDFAEMKENFAIGSLPKGGGGMIVYRFQEVSALGPFQEHLLIRFPLKK